MAELEPGPASSALLPDPLAGVGRDVSLGEFGWGMVRVRQAQSAAGLRFSEHCQGSTFLVSTWIAAMRATHSVEIASVLSRH